MADENNQVEEREFYDAEGNAFRIPLEKGASFDDIGKRLTEAEELRKQKDQWDQEKTELAQAANPNWKAIRDKQKRMEEALTRKGVKVDEEGNPIDDQVVDIKRVRETAQEEIREQLLNEYLNEEFEHFGDQKEAARVYFNKLMTGEERNLSNAKNVMKDVETFMGGGNSGRKAIYVLGRPPQTVKKKENFANTERGAEMARRLGIDLEDK